MRVVSNSTAVLNSSAGEFEKKKGPLRTLSAKGSCPISSDQSEAGEPWSHSPGQISSGKQTRRKLYKVSKKIQIFQIKNLLFEILTMEIERVRFAFKHI